MAEPYYITVNDDPDYWGDCSAADDFDPATEAATIREAAEEAGFDVYETRPNWIEDYEDYEIDWFTTWCREGYQWSSFQWDQWFQKQHEAVA